MTKHLLSAADLNKDAAIALLDLADQLADFVGM